MIYSACLSLGSNINPELNLFAAWQSLKQRVEIRESSAIWKSPPYGSDGPNFLNAAVLISSEFNLEELKWVFLRSLESHLGRVRTDNKYAPRTIDLDVVIFENEVVDAAIWEQAFLAVPCAQILPEIMNPHTRQTLSQTAEILKRTQEISLFCSSFNKLDNLREE